MPPPFSTGLALCHLARADLPTSVITTLVSHFGGLFLSPLLLYLMVKIFICSHFLRTRIITNISMYLFYVIIYIIYVYTIVLIYLLLEK